MEQFVINIGRQLGSGGKDIGEIIARRLGVRLYDKELLTLAARQSGLCAEFFEKADEKESRSVLSTMIGYLRSPFAGDCGGVTSVLSNDALFKIQSDVIRAVAARESAVFVGRCADYILRENPRCVNVFLTADDADRIGVISVKTGKDDVADLHLIDEPIHRASVIFFVFPSNADAVVAQAVGTHFIRSGTVRGYLPHHSAIADFV